MTTIVLTVLIVLGISGAVPILFWAGRTIWRALLDAIGGMVVLLELRDEWRKEIYERTGVLPGREPKEKERNEK